MQNYAESSSTSSSTPPSSPGFKIDWAALTERAKSVLLNPKEIWPTIKAEQTTVKDLYLGWILVMTALPAVFGFLGFNIFVPSSPYTAGFFGSLWHFLVQYATQLIMIYVAAVIMEKLAANFGGATDTISTLKLLAYASTASYIAGITLIQPLIGGLVGIIAAIYTLYTLWQGIPVMTGVPQEKRIPYVCVSILACAIAGLVLFLVIGIISTPLVRVPNFGAELLQ